MSSIADNLKYQFKAGGMYLKLIYVNAAIFLSVGITLMVGTLMKNEIGVSHFIYNYLAVSTDLKILIVRPWTLISSMFLQIEFFHLLSNMLYLFFLGRLLEGYLGQKKILSLYIVGGVVGSVLQISAKNIFPLFADMPDYPIIGASGAVFAIAVGLITYAPQLEVNLFGIIRTRVMIIVGLLFLLEFLRLHSLDGVAHFAHVGGGIFGFLSMYYFKKGTDILAWADNLQDRLRGRKVAKKPKMKVKYSKFRDQKKSKNSQPPRDDYEYNASKADQQEKLDKILDKIKYKGYDGLTKEEKEFLNRF